MKFKRVDIHHRTLGGTVINWEMEHPTPDDITFEVWASRPTVDDWRLVAAVSDGMSAVDITRQQYGVSTRVSYRIDAYSGDDSISTTKVVGKHFNDTKKNLIAQEIIRKEEMLMRKKTGTSGLLWKRRHWGALCECVDPDSGMAMDSHCLQCYGTGIDGGYFAPVPYIVSFNEGLARQIDISDGGVGTVDTRQGPTVRALICPRLDSGDVWVNCDTDQRYVVGAIKETLYSGKALLYSMVQMSLAPSSDIIYSLPLEGDPAGEGGRVLINDGRLLLFDTILDGYYPVAIVGGALAVFSETEPALTVKAEDGKLLVFNVTTGGYNAIGVYDGSLEWYDDPAAAPAVELSNGVLRLYDPVQESYWRIGLMDGSFTVFEEISP